MSRLPDAMQRLDTVLQRWRSEVFEWGRADCCQFVGEACLAVTGRDFRKLFPAYTNEFGALRLIATYGGMEGLLSNAFGAPKHPAYAQRGDVVLCDMGAGPLAAICIGAHCVAPSIVGGLERRLVTTATHAWTI